MLAGNIGSAGCAAGADEAFVTGLTAARGFSVATPAPAGFSSVELQLATPNAANKERITSVKAKRYGVQKRVVVATECFDEDIYLILVLND
jgi:hypothetical protein